MSGRNMVATGASPSTAAKAVAPAELKGSDRKRVSLPRADQSVIDWWDAQHDPSLSVRLLIRNEIEKTGYTDIAFAPVNQLPRRGRPPAESYEKPEGESSSVASGVTSEAAELEEAPARATETVSEQAAPSATPTPVAEVKPEPVAELEPVTEPELVTAGSSASSKFDIDDLMNG